MFTFHDISSYRRSLKHQIAKKHNMLQLATIVHDLKTPLNCISGTVQIFKSILEMKNPEFSRNMRGIDSSFEFLFSMIEDI